MQPILGEGHEPMAGVSLIIPAYNEEPGIGKTLVEAEASLDRLPMPVEIIVVDDCSRDRTAEIVGAHPVRLIRHGTNLGYGAALKTGIRHSRYEWIAIADADGTYPIEQLPKLLGFVGEFDMVVGARLGKEARIPPVRKPAKWVLGKLANYVARRKIPDLNSGFRVMRRGVVERFFPLLPSGFSFTTTITLAMLTGGYNVQFVPVSYRPRLGRSKIRPVRDTLNFLSLVLRTALFFDPFRVIVPIGGALLAMGAAKLAHDVAIYEGHVATSTILVITTGLQIAVMGLIADLIVRLQRG